MMDVQRFVWKQFTRGFHYTFPWVLSFIGQVHLVIQEQVAKLAYIISCKVFDGGTTKKILLKDLQVLLLPADVTSLKSP